MKVALAVLSLTAVLAATGESVTITFEPGPPAPIIGRIIPQWSEAGFLFSTPNGISHYNSVENRLGSDNGSPHLKFTVLPPQSPLAITNITGASFNAISVDLAEYSAVFQSPKAILFVGTRADSSSVFTTFMTDGIVDGSGGRDDFETFLFPSSFINLRSITVDTNLYGLDNLVLNFSPVPPHASVPETMPGWVFNSVIVLLVGADVRRRLAFVR